MHTRTLDLVNLLKKRSFFLFGPRTTGKSTLIESSLKNAIVYDLLKPETFRRASGRRYLDFLSRYVSPYAPVSKSRGLLGLIGIQR